MEVDQIARTTAESLQLGICALSILVGVAVLTTLWSDGGTRASGRRPTRSGGRGATRRSGPGSAGSSVTDRLLHWIGLRLREAGARLRELLDEERPHAAGDPAGEGTRAGETPPPPIPAAGPPAGPPDPGELKLHYRRLVKTWHPDLCLDPEDKRVCQEITIQLNALYETENLEAMLRLGRRAERILRAAQDPGATSATTDKLLR